MDRINGFTFLMGSNERQGFADDKAKQSMKLLKECTGSNTVTLAFIAYQETAFSEEIDFTGSHMPTDDEVKEMIRYAHALDMQVILKPMVDCKDGIWRARIDFFDIEEPCETSWRGWFTHYNAYITHYAAIAEEEQCEMLLIGCELVQSERKELYWRKLIKKVRAIYKGMISYNTDKYQEDHVKWWDALDAISSSGYYPIDAWDENLKRIEEVVVKYKKPFFFAECGIPCRTGSRYVPNDWTFEGELNQKEQEEYYRIMFEKIRKYSYVQGQVGWAWYAILPKESAKDDDYSVYGKPACEVIRRFYTEGQI